eukprot:SAG11_NODE_24584_length_371_cov_0.812500_1_plen_25_part_01
MQEDGNRATREPQDVDEEERFEAYH